MKKIIFTTTLLAFAAAGFAQQNPERVAPTPEQVAQKDANTLSERLSLTEDQRSKAYSVYLDRAKDQKKERDARMKEMQKMRENGLAQTRQQDEKISKLLNEDQKKKYQQFTEQRQKMRQGNGRPGFGGARMNRPGNRQAFRQDFRKQQFKRPGGPGLNFQRRPNPQFQQRGDGFQGRPDMRNQFRGPGAQSGRPQMNDGARQNLQNRPERFQNRPDGIQNRPDSLQRFNRRASLQKAPDNIQVAPSDKK